MNVCPGSLIGRPGRISCSFPNAMFEPQNETEPTIAANTLKIATYVGGPPTCKTPPESDSDPGGLWRRLWRNDDCGPIVTRKSRAPYVLP